MKLWMQASVCLWALSMPNLVHAQNVEDEEIPDEVVTAAQAPVAPPVQNPAPANAPQTAAPANTTPGEKPATNSDTVTIPRAELEALKAQQAETQRQLEELRKMIGSMQPAAPPTPSTSPAPVTSSDVPPANVDDSTSTEPVAATGGNRNLLLPDISLVVTGQGRVSNDRRDEDRNRFRLNEAELAIQGYVYPNVKADAYIVAAPGEDAAAQVEEGFLTFQGLRKNLNVEVGRRFAAFGRTGQLHPHSWLYTRQLLPFRNLVSEEALIGDGVQLRYTIPASKRLFANFSLGLFNAAAHAHGAEEHGHGHEGEEHEGEDHDHDHDEESVFGEGLPNGRGASYEGRFYNARLWLGYALNENSELELGTSYARGRSILEPRVEGEVEQQGRVALSGFDVSFRRFLSGERRLLLRAEYFRNSPTKSLQSQLERASGYYGLANYRFNRYNDLGFLYENSGFPQAPGQHEKALSLIYTRQFTEQFYIRLQGTRGNRPGSGNYNEANLQFTWGLGPHTHSLE
jgi:hypothetical protein